jgi:hypothetical protein
MREYGLLPRARQDGLLEERVDEELLLYDQNSHTAHCLSPVAACVWRHCDGEHDVTELAQLAGVSGDLVADALRELRDKDLLDAEPQVIQGTVPGESRRQAIVRAARYGAAAVAGSMVVSATAATPAMASSEETCCQCVDKNLGNCRCFACPGNDTETGQDQCKKLCESVPSSCPNLQSATCSKNKACTNGITCGAA